ncbi:hypothetical protein [Paenibacillus polymyxa]|uniref:hypothetical protein n=1 Tax=Paenibacillus polymyxa TaxID=1406 RepID=UPI002ED276CB
MHKIITQSEGSTDILDKMNREMDRTARPAKASGRAPILSNSRPLIGLPIPAHNA